MYTTIYVYLIVMYTYIVSYLVPKYIRYVCSFAPRNFKDGTREAQACAYTAEK